MDIAPLLLGPLVVTIVNGIPDPAVVDKDMAYFDGVTCLTAMTCEAVGASASGVGAIAPMTNGVPGTAQTVAGFQSFNHVVCPSASPCLAVGAVFGTAPFPLPAQPLVAITAAAISFPRDGQTEVNTNRAITWASVPGAQAYYLVVGSSPQGTDLLNSGVLGATTSSVAMPAFPPGVAVYATLLTKRDGAWIDFSAVTFTALRGQATFAIPVNGQLNWPFTAPFTWATSPTSGGTVFTLGTRPYGTDLVNSGILPASQSTYGYNGGLPGGLLYATLYSEVNGAFTRYQQIVFTAAAGGAAFVNPIDGATNVDTSKPFTWPASGQGYVLLVGRTRYGTDLLKTGILPSTQSSFPMPSLPSDVTLYATLFTKANGQWVNFQAITFTAARG